MIITPAALAAAFVGFKKHFQDGQTSVEPMYLKVASHVPSSTSSNTYAWLGKVPGMREWVGNRQLNNMAAHAYSILNKHWESTITVGRDEIEDDQLGIYAPMMKELGHAAKLHPDKMVFPLLKAGFDDLCFDGQPFFDTEHPVNATADGTGAVTATSNMLEDAAYTGEAWYLMDASRAIKPIIFQQRKAPKFEQMTDSKDEQVFMSNEYRFGVDCRDNVGFGFWQMAFGAKAALTYDTVWAAYASMRSLTADGGDKLGIRPTILVVPVSLEQAARRLIDREKLDNGESNELYKKFEIVVPDYL